MCSPKVSAPPPVEQPPQIVEQPKADPVDLKVGDKRKDTKKRRGLSALRIGQPTLGGTSSNGVNLG